VPAAQDCVDVGDHADCAIYFMTDDFDFFNKIPKSTQRLASYNQQFHVRANYGHFPLIPRVVLVYVFVPRNALDICRCDILGPRHMNMVNGAGRAIGHSAVSVD